MNRSVVRNIHISLLLLLSLPLTVAADPIINDKSARPLYVEGELLVKAKKGLSLRASKEFISSVGHTVAKQLNNNGLMLLKLDKTESVQAAMNRYKATSAYELIQPNFYYYPMASPNDADYSQLWGLKNTGQTISAASYTGNNPGLAGNDIDAELAWGLQSDCSSAIVAVIDTGVNYNHSDLTANRWVNSAEIAGNSLDDDNNGYIDDVYGYDTVDNDGDPMPTDLATHGTHVAGTIGAKGDNSIGMAGVCKSAKIMSLRALGTSGGTTATVVAAINYAVTNGAKVINMSLGGSSSDPSFSSALDRAKTAGVVVVVAAGNDAADNNFTSSYPCNYTHDNLLCVAALDQSYALASFSNYGSDSVDIGAPGTNIYSAWPGTQISDDFTGWSGVSYVSANDVWYKSSCTFASGNTYDTLVYPKEQCGGTYGPYINNRDERAYKNFDLSSSLVANVEYYARIRTADSGDTFSLGYKSAGGDPFAAGTVVSSISGDQGTSWNKTTKSLAGCLSSTCTVGFKFKSDASGVSEGVSVILMKINTVQPNSTSYKVINGTSMAAPHAAGVAALVYSFNSTYTAAQVVTALKNSGESASSLLSKTSTGKALNAYNALRYIQAPTGITTVIP